MHDIGQIYEVVSELVLLVPVAVGCVGEKGFLNVRYMQPTMRRCSLVGLVYGRRRGRGTGKQKKNKIEGER